MIHTSLERLEVILCAFELGLGRLQLLASGRLDKLNDPLPVELFPEVAVVDVATAVEQEALLDDVLPAAPVRSSFASRR
jgi:hypothetical protein